MVDDELDIQPWPVLELLGRAVTLVTVAKRGMIELDDQADVFSRETDRFELSTWARTELSHWITPAELAVLNASIDQLTEEQLDLCDEALHAAGAVVWALRGVTNRTLPIGNNDAFNSAVLEWSPGPWDQVRSLQKRVRLHSDEELAEERERAELWYWRGGGAVSKDDLADVVAEIAEIDLFPVIDGDFATDTGIAFAALSEEEQEDITYIAGCRLRALNWVCGFGESWETAPLELD